MCWLFFIFYYNHFFQLPGVELLGNQYQFHYGRNPLIEVPLTINPTGCARSEPRLRTLFFKRYVQDVYILGIFLSDFQKILILRIKIKF